jgi:hypothetical protein
VPQVGRWSKGTGRGALSLLRRTVPLQLCKFAGSECTETRMRSCVIVILAQAFDDPPRFGQTAEKMFVQALVE